MIDKIFRLVKLLYRATPSWLRILVGITISGVLAWLAFREQNLEEVITAFKGYPVWSALLGLLLFFISLWFRAIRWRVLLIDEKTSTFQLFLTQNAGTGINNVLPIRILSEPIQLALVTKKYGMGGSEEEDKAEDKGLAGIESKITDADTRSETQGGELGSVPGYKTASIIKKQLSDPTADLINLELDILGDPYYLVQEDFNPNVFPRSEVNAYELDDGAIDANNGQVYLKINLLFRFS